MGERKAPQRPTHLPEYSETCLQALVQAGLAEKISLGGALGLLHYLDYRSTHDVDAWWSEDVKGEERNRVVAVIEAALRPFGSVRTRSWGDVVSIELQREGRKVFSFQIARRSAQLEPSRRAPWIEVLLDSFPDLLAGKMVALVERGAPRDFRDIYALCQARLTTPAECWHLWQRRQALAGSDTDLRRGRLAVMTHLARIVQHRRLEQIGDPQERAEAARVRAWFAEVFLGEADENAALA
jgi:hypothetical protein